MRETERHSHRRWCERLVLNACVQALRGDLVFRLYAGLESGTVRKLQAFTNHKLTPFLLRRVQGLIPPKGDRKAGLALGSTQAGTPAERQLSSQYCPHFDDHCL